MLVYVVKRLLATIPVMLVVAVVVFSMLRLTAGDPAAIIAGDNATSQDIAAIRAKLGLERPIVEQFGIWISKVVRGDFGEPFFFKRTVASLIAERIEPTLALTVLTLRLTVCMAVPLGIVAAWRRDTWIDRGVMGLSVLGFSVPVFVIGYAFIYLFATQFAWLPVQGYQRLSEGIGGFLERLILPSVTLSVIYVALIARTTRASVLEVLDADHVRTARAKGLGELPVLIRHVLRNASVPIVTVIGFGVALLIGVVCASAIIVEAILSVLGVGIPPETPTWGNIMAEGRALFRIFPHNILFPGIFLAVTVLAVNMLGDGLRDTLDPRVRKRR